MISSLSLFVKAESMGGMAPMIEGILCSDCGRHIPLREQKTYGISQENVFFVLHCPDCGKDTTQQGLSTWRRDDPYSAQEWREGAKAIRILSPPPAN